MGSKKKELQGALGRLARALEAQGAIEKASEVEIETWSPGDNVTRYRLAIRGREVGSYSLGAGEMLGKLNFASDLLDRVTPREKR